MIFGLLYFCVVILCVNRSRSSFILYRIVKRHSRQSNVRRIWTCADNVYCFCQFLVAIVAKTYDILLSIGLFIVLSKPFRSRVVSALHWWV